MKFVRHSPSSLNLFCAAPAKFVLEKILDRRQPVGAPAFRGTAVEDGVAHGLKFPEAALSECVAAAESKYDTLTALTTDARREDFRNSIPAMVTSGLEELRPYGIPTSMQGYVEWRPADLVYPIVGYYDFAWEQHGIVVDLKTTDRLPSAIKVPHARQMALYASELGGNLDPRISYVTPKKRATYRLENVRDHLNALHQIALRCEAFLALSEDPNFFTSVTVPDLDSFYWNGPARQLAFEIWKV